MMTLPSAEDLDLIQRERELIKNGHDCILRRCPHHHCRICEKCEECADEQIPVRYEPRLTASEIVHRGSASSWIDVFRIGIIVILIGAILGILLGIGMSEIAVHIMESL